MLQSFFVVWLFAFVAPSSAGPPTPPSEEREKRLRQLQKTAADLEQCLIKRDVEAFLRLCVSTKVGVGVDYWLTRAQLRRALLGKRGFAYDVLFETASERETRGSSPGVQLGLGPILERCPNRFREVGFAVKTVPPDIRENPEDLDSGVILFGWDGSPDEFGCALFPRFTVAYREGQWWIVGYGDW
jgi:hypothetical protein